MSIKAKSEGIVVLDTVNYVDQYCVKGKIKSDTSTNWFSSFFQEPYCSNMITLNNFFILDSTFYWTYENNYDGSLSLTYFQNDYYTKTPILKVEVDDNNNVLETEAKREKLT